MYKLIVVDDEAAIRNGIAHGLPWAEWGFEVTAALANGLEAVEAIKKDKPHVVLSDIKMPKMDGVELMQYLNKNYPEIKIVILSGYNDFEYLNMSIKNEVTEYLLKPTDLDEFEELFRKLKLRLDKEQQKAEELKDLKRNLVKSQLNNLIRGYGFTEEEMNEMFRTEEAKQYVVMVIDPDDKPQDKEELYQLQRTIVRLLEKRAEANKRNVGYFRTYDDYVAGIGKSALGLSEEELLGGCREVQEFLQEAMGISITIGISSLNSDFYMLPQCYEEAKTCIGPKRPRGSRNSILYYTNLSKADNKTKNSLALAIKNLVDQEYCSNLMSLEYVATKVCKNTAYISRIFKNEFECNFSDYVTGKRLEYAKELLENPALKVYEIAEKIGWADVSNFIKVFKRRFDMSPNEYRNRES